MRHNKPVLGEPREAFDVYVGRCAYCETFPLQSLVMKGNLARCADPMRAREILERFLAGEEVSLEDILWLSENWPGAGEAAQKWQRSNRRNGDGRTPEKGEIA